MVIRTEYRGQRYSMGSSKPLPAGFEIRFGSLNFQATRNGYLMRITNRDELRARWQTGADPASVSPATHALACAHVDVMGPSAPRRCRRSGQRSRQARTEHRCTARAASQRDATTGEMAATPAGERSVSGPRFPIGLHGATTAYTAFASTDAATRGVRPGRHVPAVTDPSASADNESSHGSASELPPATSHGYGEWDFSGVPDPVMFQRLLDTTDYRFGYSDNSSAGSYDPARECFVVLAKDQANAANAAEAGDGEVPQPGNWTAQGCGAKQSSLLAAEGGATSTRNWLKHASLKPSSRGVPRGPAASSLHCRRSLRAR
jgi:hypothetical protein